MCGPRAHVVLRANPHRFFMDSKKGFFSQRMRSTVAALSDAIPSEAVLSGKRGVALSVPSRRTGVDCDSGQAPDSGGSAAAIPRSSGRLSRENPGTT